MTNATDRHDLLKGKVALVTGASRGIGKAITELYAREGAIVYAVTNEVDSMGEFAQELSAANDTQVVPMYFDICDKDAAKDAFMRIKKEQGRLDILVNNAGITHNCLLGSVTRDTMEKMFQVNVYALIEFMQFASKIMMRQKSGSIINISSIVGQRGSAGQLIYSATKGAVISVTKSAAKELAPHNIRVNSIAPGLTDTDAMRKVEMKNLEQRISNIAMGRFAQPEDIAGACVFLGSDMSSYISGEILGVNGCSIM